MFIWPPMRAVSGDGGTLAEDEFYGDYVVSQETETGPSSGFYERSYENYLLMRQPQ